MEQIIPTLDAPTLHKPIAELTDEELEKLFLQTPEDQGLTEDETLPI